MLYQAKQYLKFLKKSTNQHGVHSPFVYNLVTQCFYNKTKYKDYTTLKQYRESLYKNNTTISVTDFGAGSRIFKTNQRQVSKIAKTAGITKKRAQLLYRITNYLQAKNTLELGTSLGLATVALSLANKNGNVTSIEGCPETAQIAKQQLEAFHCKNTTLKTSNFNTELHQLNTSVFDLIYIDGNHQKEATLHYFESLLHNIHNDSLIIFDDIHWSASMTEAWQEIMKHPKVTVTIDTFFWGFAFFRKEQEKEHFTIRV
ncbi:class I SAM-dependent methyltransferase [Lacinutrix sp. C3R15]|uniref:O-methyltransferase n=1 Tax=Flavobacteriaceae TaxID=49546 RepID=UPI001C08D3E6|nr:MULTISPECIES: class I SAM-dependent methyltransferase [Flavobacteriaceae]MBU2939551.1 class I SAM-dependent methyltransferase [Lacinutrix sp. C3R15]MDO6622865.1 class I SAM-dependent methyltransferase [Oceanihabitans sp. 1_MG-2023]